MSTPPTMICVIVLAKVRPGKEEDARSALAATAASTRQEPGCLQYDLHVDLSDPGSLAIYERWRDQAALDAHMKMPYVQSLFARLPELLSEPPSMKSYRLHG
jgi:quinol monooxygenase YgiN